MLVHNDLEDDELEDAAPRARVLRPVHEEDEPEPKRNQRKAVACTKENEAEAEAMASLERAIQNGATQKTIDRAHDRLEAARAETIAKTKRSEEQAALAHNIARRKAIEEQTTLARVGAAAAETVRESKHFSMSMTYRTVTLTVWPNRTHDSALRLITLQAYRAAAHWISQLAEHDVLAAKVSAQGKQATPGYTTQGLVTKLQDDLRSPLRNNLAEIVVKE